MEKLKLERAILIQKLRRTNDLNEQYKLKRQIDRLEEKMMKVKKY